MAQRDHIARFVGLLGYSSPTFWLGLMGLIVFYAALGWVGGPAGGMFFIDQVETRTGMLLVDAIDGDGEVFWNAFSHIVLPGDILGYASMAYISRMTRSFMLEQLSQEYIIAARVKGLMLMAEPDLLIADEPTSALDVTVRMQVLAILDDLVTRRGLGLIFISHDLNLVATFCDRVLIMYAGRIVEECAAAELAQAKHPYTQGLLASLPRIGDRRDKLAVLSRDPAWLDG